MHGRDHKGENFALKITYMLNKSKFCLFFASGAHCGFSPKAPGTVGSLIALPLCFALSRIDLASSILFILLFIFFGIWVADVAEKTLNQTDPGCIVIDEMAGLMVTFIYIPFSFLTACMGFMLFRGLDIFKPFPISWIEKKCSGGFGIMADDIAAGIISNIFLRVIISFTTI